MSSEDKLSILESHEHQKNLWIKVLQVRSHQVTQTMKVTILNKKIIVQTKEKLKSHTLPSFDLDFASSVADSASWMPLIGINTLEKEKNEKESTIISTRFSLPSISYICPFLQPCNFNFSYSFFPLFYPPIGNWRILFEWKGRW